LRRERRQSPLAEDDAEHAKAKNGVVTSQDRGEISGGADGSA
jgi:hypothetical protein